MYQNSFFAFFSHFIFALHNFLFYFIVIRYIVYNININVINNKANNNKIEEKKIRKSKDEMGEKGNKGIFFFSQIVKSS